jgi:hypothetical protein
MIATAPAASAIEPKRAARRLASVGMRVGVAGLLAGLLVGMGGLGGPAVTAAANFDSGTGALQTASGAVAWFDTQCGGTRGFLNGTFGAVTPHLYRFAQRRVGGAWSAWFPWARAFWGTTNVPLTLPGDWQFMVQIAYWNGRSWEYDSEMALHTNYEVPAFAYIIRASCHISK